MCDHNDEKDQDKITCPICFINFEDNNICVTKCNHTFHLNCLLTSLDKKNSCPLCRRKVKENPLIDLTLDDDDNDETVLPSPVLPHIIPIFVPSLVAPSFVNTLTNYHQNQNQNQVPEVLYMSDSDDYDYDDLPALVPEDPADVPRNVELVPGVSGDDLPDLIPI